MIQSLVCANKLLKTGTKEQVSSEHYTVLKATGSAQAGGKFEYGVSETTSPGFGAVTLEGRHDVRYPRQHLLCVFSFKLGRTWSYR